MAMKPNYRFERSERAKAKAQKKAAKLQAKAEKSEARKQSAGPDEKPENPQTN